MSGLYENLPFQRGHTYGAADNTVAVHLEGREYIIEDDQYQTGGYVRLRIVRNNSGVALTGRRCLKFNKTAGKAETDVAGYATVAGERSAISDDQITGAGIPNGDLFYAVVGGPCLVKTGLAGDAGNSIAVGDFLQALTAATTGATTSGRIGEAVLTGATGVLAANIFGVIGQAMSAATTANTNADLLVRACQVPMF